MEQLRKSNDPTVETVASEDSAAVVGLVLAAGGPALHQLTGSAVFDGGASIAIGVLLGWVAYVLGRSTKELLIGEAADPELRLDIIGVLTGRRSRGEPRPGKLAKLTDPRSPPGAQQQRAPRDARVRTWQWPGTVVSGHYTDDSATCRRRP